MKINQEINYRRCRKIVTFTPAFRTLKPKKTLILLSLACLIVLACSGSPSKSEDKTKSKSSETQFTETSKSLNNEVKASTVISEISNPTHSASPKILTIKQNDEQVDSAKSGLVKNIVDGLTILVETDSGELLLKYAGVFLPSQEFSVEERFYNSEKLTNYNNFLVSGGEISYVVSDHSSNTTTTKFAYVYLDGRMINTTLIETGHVLVDLSSLDLKKKSEFIASEEKAKASKVGIWAVETTTAQKIPPETGLQFLGGTLPHHSLIKGRDVCEFSNTLLPVIKGLYDKTFVTPSDPSYHNIVIDIKKGDKWFCTEHQALAEGWNKIGK